MLSNLRYINNKNPTNHDLIKNIKTNNNPIKLYDLAPYNHRFLGPKTVQEPQKFNKNI